MNADVIVSHLIQEYRRAVGAKDAAALLALYEPGTRVFDLWVAWQFDGSDAWRGSLEDWFGSLDEDERVVVTVDDVRTIASDQLIAASAFISYASQQADGDPDHAMANRLTWVLRPHGDAWLIAHEHTSAPIDGDTLKVILDRS
ncbi:nuclear transport factor 2 family protein [Rathayibacter sp. YIM 133350]|uniref:nuclear transport factor 2 family protein n=1 Tax=Rathayibacter sp. YIM 133350 TaxID=3131992 RepID=UPI00307ED648